MSLEIAVLYCANGYVTNFILSMRYIKVRPGVLFAQETISKTDLGAVKQRIYDTIIDLQHFTYFDVDNNQWLPISILNSHQDPDRLNQSV